MSDDFSIKAFMLNVVLWLPLAFFIWFYLAGLLIIPVQWGLNGVLELVYADLFDGVARDSYWLQVAALIQLPEGRAAADIPVNPMIYGYGLPLVVGLAISTRTSGRRRALQILAVYVVTVVVQIWGSFWEVFRTLAFEMGEPGQIVQQQAGLGSEVIALCYQFGYLILPAVAPIVVWILANRTFIEGVMRRRIEPHGPAQGQ